MLRFLLLLITSCAALGPPQVLLVSGSDSGGGAGLQAEIKTCEALGVFSTNAVTAITAQNTVGVHGVHGLPPAFVVEQMDAVFDDFAVDAVKTGLLASVDVVEAVARRLRAADVGGVVVDPVVCAASGDVFVDDATIEAIKAELLPLATVITPNAAEAQLLGGEAVEGTLSVDRARALAARLLEHGPRAVVVKGARLGEDEAPSMAWIGPPRAPGDDVIVDVCAFADGAVATLACPARCETRPPRPPDDLRAGPAVATRNTHGTGCTFSAAVASNRRRQHSSPDGRDSVLRKQGCGRARWAACPSPPARTVCWSAKAPSWKSNARPSLRRCATPPSSRPPCSCL